MNKNFHIKGLDKLLKDLTALGVDGIKRIGETTEANARDIEANAKSFAPYDFGTLRMNIKAFNVSLGNLSEWKILANAFGNAPYSAYMEFGTGGEVEVPQELKEMAIKFKGKGIKQVDLRPRPFMYPALIQGRKQYLKDLEGDLKDLTKKV